MLPHTWILTARMCSAIDTECQKEAWAAGIYYPTAEGQRGGYSGAQRCQVLCQLPASACLSLMVQDLCPSSQHLISIQAGLSKSTLSLRLCLSGRTAFPRSTLGTSPYISLARVVLCPMHLPCSRGGWERQRVVLSVSVTWDRFCQHIIQLPTAKWHWMAA